MSAAQDETSALRARIATLEQELRDMSADVEHLQSQHDVLENFVFALEREHEKARAEVEEARGALAASYTQLSELKVYQDEILANVRQGIVIIARDGVIQPGYSHAAEHLLGQKALAGAAFFDVLGASAPPSLPRFLNLAFRATQASASLLEQANPLRSLRHRDLSGKTRVLRFTFARVMSDAEDRRVVKLMAVIDDRTLEEELHERLERELEERSKKLDQAYRLLTIPTDAFSDFADDVRGVVTRLRAEATQSSALSAPARLAWLEKVHSLKGAASTLGLDSFAQRADQIEDVLQNAGARSAELAGLAQHMLEELEEGASVVERLARLKEALSGTRDQALEDLARQLQGLCERDARAAGIDVRFEYRLGERVVLTPRDLYRLRSALIQLVRNAVAHGGEPASERVKRDKPAALLVELTVEVAAGFCTARVRDDGKGVDLGALRSRASCPPGLSDQEVVNLAFKRGLSTRNTADALAGRGVGLSAVKSAMDGLSGSATLTSTLGLGTTCELRFPLSYNRRRGDR